MFVAHLLDLSRVAGRYRCESGKVGGKHERRARRAPHALYCLCGLARRDGGVSSGRTCCCHAEAMRRGDVP